LFWKTFWIGVQLSSPPFELMFIRKPFFFRKFYKKPVILTNEQIKVPKVQVIDDTGKNLGILDISKAIELARERELDLVEISSKAQPPICKIINFGKYQYIQEKKAKRQKAKQKKLDLKQIRIGFTTSSHDLEIKAKQIERFLKEGHKVRIELRLRGREKAHSDLAREKVEKFLEIIHFEFKKEEEIKRNPFGISTIICQGKPKNQ